MQQEQYSISIPKTAIADMPIVNFPGQITMIDTADDVDAAVDYLMKCPIIGFDTETRPSFQKGHTNKVALLQLSTPDRCFLFRLNRIGFPSSLVRLIESPEVKKIGLSIHDDFSVMHRSGSFNPNGFVDLQKEVGQYRISDISLQKIYAIIFGEKISKGQRLTNWEASQLTPQQQAYAAIDAWACLKIYNYLNDGEFDPAASPWKVYPESETQHEES